MKVKNLAGLCSWTNVSNSSDHLIFVKLGSSLVYLEVQGKDGLLSHFLVQQPSIRLKMVILEDDHDQAEHTIMLSLVFTLHL